MRVLKQRVLFCASIFVFALMASRPGLAQAVPPPYLGTIYPGDGALRPYEIVAIVSSTGLEPLGRPIRQGPAYAVRAVDAAGRRRKCVRSYLKMSRRRGCWNQRYRYLQGDLNRFASTKSKASLRKRGILTRQESDLRRSKKSSFTLCRLGSE